MKKIPHLMLLLLAVLAACSGDGSEMRAQLEELERQNRADSVMTNDSLAELLVKYFDRHGTPNERMRAHYILGRTYADMVEAPRAVDAYLDAADCADTTATDCDYHTLNRVYSQMANVFYWQNLMEDYIKACDKSIEYAWKDGDTLQALNAKAHIVAAYNRMKQYDKVIASFDDVFDNLMQAFGVEYAAKYCTLPVYALIEKGYLSKAKAYIDIYRTESGYFNTDGNVEKGREVCYYYMGLYYLLEQQIDSSEFYFRKELQTGLDADNQQMASRGLSLLFSQTHQPDSAAKYALYGYEVLDSIFARKSVDEVERMAALHNYTRHQTIANREHLRAEQEKAKKEHLFVILLFVVAIVGLAWILIARKRRLEAERIRQLNQALSSAKREQQIVMKELDDLKAMNYDELISQKEQQRLNLQKYIAKLEGRSGKVSLRDFKESQIVKTFAEKSQFSKDHPVPNQAEWDMLEQQFRKDMPGLYRLFEDKGLSDLEFRTCLLLLLDYDEGTIAGLTQSSSQTINSAKVRANQKLFNEKGAKSLHRALKKLI